MDSGYNETSFPDQDFEPDELYSGRLYDVNRILFEEAKFNKIDLTDIESFESGVRSAAGKSDGVVYVDERLGSEILENGANRPAALKDEEDDRLYGVKVRYIDELENLASKNDLDVINESLERLEGDRVAFYSPGNKFGDRLNPREVSLAGWGGLIMHPEDEGIEYLSDWE